MRLLKVSNVLPIFNHSIHNALRRIRMCGSECVFRQRQARFGEEEKSKVKRAKFVMERSMQSRFLPVEKLGNVYNYYVVCIAFVQRLYQIYLYLFDFCFPFFPCSNYFTT